MTYPRDAIQSRLDDVLPDRILIALKDGPMTTQALCYRLNVVDDQSVFDACQDLRRRQLIRFLHKLNKPSMWEVVT